MLSSISLTNFRNYSNSQVEFLPGFNCLLGRNGQGKTNILEAIYYLSLLRSFRTGNVNEIRQFEKSFFSIRGMVPERCGIENELFVSYGAERQTRVNGVSVYRASDFINKFICVSFLPQDLGLVQGSPAQRRKYIDISLSQISPVYLKHLQAYNEALRSRNAMLKDIGRYPKELITAFDRRLAYEASEIEVARIEFVSKLNVELSKLSPVLLKDSRLISLKYLSKIGHLMQELNGGREEIEARYLDNLAKCLDKNIEQGSTSIGPHRSDFSSLLGDVMMIRYSSQGECRIGSLALKLACLNIVRREIGDYGVTMLVDDVIGELDNERKTCFFNAIKDIGQCIFACTEIPSELKIDRLFIIENGEVKTR